MQREGRKAGTWVAIAWRLELERIRVKEESSFRRLVSGVLVRNNGGLAESEAFRIEI